MARPRLFGEKYREFLERSGCIIDHSDPELRMNAVDALGEIILKQKEDNNWVNNNDDNNENIEKKKKKKKHFQACGHTLLLYAQCDGSLPVKESALQSLFKTQKVLTPPDCAQYLDPLSSMMMRMMALQEETQQQQQEGIFFRNNHHDALLECIMANIAELGKTGATPDMRRSCCKALLQATMAGRMQGLLLRLLASFQNVIEGGDLQEGHGRYCYEFLHGKALHGDNHGVRQRAMSVAHQLDSVLLSPDNLRMRIDFFLDFAKSERDAELRRMALFSIKKKAHTFSSVFQKENVIALRHILHNDADTRIRMEIPAVIGALTEFVHGYPPLMQFSMENRMQCVDMLLDAVRSDHEENVRASCLRRLGGSILVEQMMPILARHSFFEDIRQIYGSEENPHVRQAAVAAIGELAFKVARWEATASYFRINCTSMLQRGIFDASDQVIEQSLQSMISYMTFYQNQLPHSLEERTPLEVHYIEAVLEFCQRQGASQKIRLAALDLLGHIANQSLAETCHRFCQFLFQISISQAEDTETRKVSWKSLATVAKARPKDLEWLLQHLVWVRDFNAVYGLVVSRREMAAVVGYAALEAGDEVLETSCEFLVNTFHMNGNTYSAIFQSIDSLSEILLKRCQGNMFTLYLQEIFKYSIGNASKDPRCHAMSCIGKMSQRTELVEVRRLCLEHLLQAAKSDRDYYVRSAALRAIASVVSEPLLEAWELLSVDVLSEIVRQSRLLKSENQRHHILQAVMTLVHARTEKLETLSLKIKQQCKNILLGVDMESALEQENAATALWEALNARTRRVSIPVMMFYEIAKCQDVTSVVRGRALDCMCRDFYDSKPRCEELLLDLVQNCPDTDIRQKAKSLCEKFKITGDEATNS